MGNPDFAVPALERLLRSEHEVAAVVTGSDKRRGRSGKRSPSPVKKTALDAEVAVIEADDVRTDEFVGHLQKQNPDLLVVVAFKIVPSRVLSVPRIGSINVHASLLPKYRGAAPIQHALINGEEETGCTVFFLDEGMDTGAILNQKKTPVGLLETAGDLYDRLKYIGADLLIKSVEEISQGTYTCEEQEKGPIVRAPKITPEEARIDFRNDNMKVHNLIRGMSPCPGAWTLTDEKKVIIYRSEPAPHIALPAGKAERIGNMCYAGCNPGSVALTEVQVENKKKMSGLEFINGMGGNVLFAI